MAYESRNHQRTFRNRFYSSQLLQGVWHAPGLHREVWSRLGREREADPGALPFSGFESGVLGFRGFLFIGFFLFFFFNWLISSMREGIMVCEERRVTQVVSYLSYPGISEGGTFVGGGGLVSCPLALLVAVSYS